MKIAGVIKPVPVAETRHVDHQCLTLPAPVGRAHPGVSIRLGWSAHIDDTLDVSVFVGKHDVVRTLDNLKWVRQISGARYTRQVTLDLRIELYPVGLILLLFRGCRWQIRNRI